MTSRNETRGFRSALAGAVAGLALVAVVAACKGDLLGVQSPSRIPAGSLEDPSNAQLLLDGAIADFDCAAGAYIVAGGLIGNELVDATQTANRYPFDQRTTVPSDLRYSTSGCEALGVYTPLQTARVSANNVRRLLEGWTDPQVAKRHALLATASAYEAYAMLLLSEGFCSTAFSHFSDDKVKVIYGDEITPTQARDSAIARFTEAIDEATAAGVDSIRYLALVGRARAYLGQGNLSGARTDAALVPAGFAWMITASTVSGRRTNRVWADNGKNGTSYNQSSSVDTSYRHLNDTRVPVDSTGKKSVTNVPIWAQLKYSSASSPIRLASGAEARLIVAEADAGTNAANAIILIQASRARGGQAPYAGAVDAASLKAEIVDQRKRELFLEGQHLGDVIRYGIPLTPAVGAAFPGGGTYGNQVCMPLPDAERNNNPLLK